MKSKFLNLNIKNSFQISNFKLQIVLFLLVLLFGILFSKNPMAGFYGLLKLLEFVFLGFVAAKTIKTAQDFKILAFIFCMGVLFESGLAILQFVKQGSIGGIFYFFGERTFTSQTSGIANASLDGKLVLRPYATFPHPNVLAGYLIIAMTTIIFNFQSSIKIKKIYFFTSLLIGSIALLFTMSRVAIILWFLMVALFIKNYVIKNSFQIISAAILVFIGSIFMFFLSSRFFNISTMDEAIVRRIELANTAITMVKDHPVFGVGLYNFLPTLPYYQKNNTGSLFTLLQPVHNIFFLIVAETGLLGLGMFLWFLLRAVLSIKTRNNLPLNTCYILLTTILILGLFDHYFLTLQQGQILFAVVLSLCFSRNNKDLV